MNQPTLREKQGYSANFKFRKSLSTEETLLKEIRKFEEIYDPRAISRACSDV